MSSYVPKDNEAVLYKTVSGGLLQVGFRCFIENQPVSDSSIKELKEKETRVAVKIPTCDIGNAITTEKRIKSNVEWEYHVVKVIEFGDYSDMMKKKYNLENFYCLEPTKSQRKFRHKKKHPDFIEYNEKENQEAKNNKKDKNDEPKRKRRRPNGQQKISSQKLLTEINNDHKEKETTITNIVTSMEDADLFSLESDEEDFGLVKKKDKCNKQMKSCSTQTIYSGDFSLEKAEYERKIKTLTIENESLQREKAVCASQLAAFLDLNKVDHLSKDIKDRMEEVDVSIKHLLREVLKFEWKNCDKKFELEPEIVRTFDVSKLKENAQKVAGQLELEDLELNDIRKDDSERETFIIQDQHDFSFNELDIPENNPGTIPLPEISEDEDDDENKHLERNGTGFNSDTMSTNNGENVVPPVVPQEENSLNRTDFNSDALLTNNGENVEPPVVPQEENSLNRTDFNSDALLTNNGENVEPPVVLQEENSLNRTEFNAETLPANNGESAESNVPQEERNLNDNEENVNPDASDDRSNEYIKISGKLYSMETINSCKKTNIRKYVAELATVLFTRKELETSSLTGKTSNAHKKKNLPTPNKLDPGRVKAIKKFVYKIFGKSEDNESLVESTLRSKCSNIKGKARKPLQETGQE